jgi:hypothetical protein
MKKLLEEWRYFFEACLSPTGIIIIIIGFGIVFGIYKMVTLPQPEQSSLVCYTDFYAEQPTWPFKNDFIGTDLSKEEIIEKAEGKYVNAEEKCFKELK